MDPTPGRFRQRSAGARPGEDRGCMLRPPDCGTSAGRQSSEERERGVGGQCVSGGSDGEGQGAVWWERRLGESSGAGG